MNEISTNIFAINNNVNVDSVSYELYSNNGYKKIICSFKSSNIQSMELFLNLKISFEFSLIAQDEVSFKQKNTYHVKGLIDEKTGIFKVEVPFEHDSSSDLFSYVRLFDEQDPENLYDKLYRERLIKQNVLEVNNFVDYTLDDDSSFVNTEKTPKQLQEELFERKKNKIQNYSYSTNLFHFFKENNQVNCFFGIDTVSYVKDNNPLKFLNDQEEFNNYIVSNNPVESVDGYVYADKQHTFVATNEFSIDLQDVLGRVYGFTFNLPKEFERSNMYGYEARISFRNIVLQYLNSELLPILRAENQYLKELELTDTFITIDSVKLSRTLSTYEAYLAETVDNASQILALYKKSPTIVLNDNLRLILLNINQTIYNIVLDGIRSNHLPSSLDDSFTKDFGSVIDVSRIDYGVKVLEDADTSLINVYSLESIVERSEQELQKYFTNLPTTVDTGDELIDITNQSPAVLSSLSLLIDGVEELDNQKSPNEDFTYDESLKYLNTINKIINKNIQKDPLIYPNTLITGISEQEAITEDRTIQNNATLNSLTISQGLNFKNAFLADNVLAIRNNIIKTFEIPSTLRTDLCSDDHDELEPIDGTTARTSIDAQTFFGNSLITYGVLNKIKSLKENDFYEPYLNIINLQSEEIKSSCIQAAYLYNFYTQERETPSFLQRENLLGQVTNFGINYHNFKSLFSVKIYLQNENQFIPLSRDVVNSLEAQRSYLCVIDRHRDINYGIETPELLRTSIYNKYFIITT